MKYNIDIFNSFMAAVQNGESMPEHELLQKLQPTILAVEQDGHYSAKQKLRIFALLSDLTNCSEKERGKYIRKTGSALRRG